MGLILGRTAAVETLALLMVAIVATLIVTSPVLSPQYLIWLAVPMAVASYPWIRPLGCVAAALTQAEFPFTWNPLFAGGRWEWLPAVIVVTRDAVLIALTVIAVRTVIRSVRRLQRTQFPVTSPRI